MTYISRPHSGAVNDSDMYITDIFRQKNPYRYGQRRYRLTRNAYYFGLAQASLSLYPVFSWIFTMVITYNCSFHLNILCLSVHKNVSISKEFGFYRASAIAIVSVCRSVSPSVCQCDAFSSVLTVFYGNDLTCCYTFFTTWLHTHSTFMSIRYLLQIATRWLYNVQGLSQ